MPRLVSKLNKNYNIQSSPEHNSFQTVITTATIEPLPKHLRHCEHVAPKTTKKIPVKKRCLKSIHRADYDIIESVSSPEEIQRYTTKKGAINLPKSLLELENYDNVHSNKNDHTNSVNETTQPILQMNKKNSTLNCDAITFESLQTSTQHGPEHKSTYFLRSATNSKEVQHCINMDYQATVKNKENYHPNILQNRKKPTLAKAKVATTKTKLKHTRKARVSRRKNVRVSSISNNSVYQMELSKLDQNRSNFDLLMDSFMKTVTKNYSHISNMSEARDATFNKQIFNSISSMDVVIRDAAGYESQYSDEAPKPIKQKIKPVARIISGLPSQNLKRTSVEFKKSPVEQKKSHASSSSSLFSLSFEKEMTSKPKQPEMVLTDADSNNEVTSPVHSKQINILSNVVVAPAKEPTVLPEAANVLSSHESTVIIPTLHPEPDLNISESILCITEVQSGITKITEEASEDYLQDLTSVAKTAEHIELKNTQIYSWIATGLPIDAVQDLKRNGEVILRSYAMIVKSYLESFKAGPLHADLIEIYDTFMKLDWEMQQHFEKH